jgi:gamma-glutamylcyclotransferase (GGCT)/AIG2-like uncharacterized protein YtfP
MNRLFAYGTLCAPSVVQAVLGYLPSSTRGILHDYYRGTIRGEVYPGITARMGHRVQGILYDLTGPRDLLLLDEYEGHLYERGEVIVEAEGKTKEALAYVVRAQCESELTEEPWSLPRFLRQHAHRFRVDWS